MLPSNGEAEGLWEDEEAETQPPALADAPRAGAPEERDALPGRELLQLPPAVVEVVRAALLGRDAGREDGQKLLGVDPQEAVDGRLPLAVVGRHPEVRLSPPWICPPSVFPLLVGLEARSSNVGQAC